ncbi:MAG: hypothetical protein ACRCVJ_18580 [Clostridium sp.]|uniref:hypothetical protein n=1 Tax=Clostridium sp. TaxID=1506 RepID=UPI003F3380BD
MKAGKILTRIKGKLGLCQCNKCFRRSIYILNFDGVPKREVCEKCKNKLIELLEN